MRRTSHWTQGHPGHMGLTYRARLPVGKLTSTPQLEFGNLCGRSSPDTPTKIMAPERQPRIVQLGCALVLFECFRVAPTIRVTQTSTLVRSIAIALAVSCAVNGFLAQHVVAGRPQTRRRFTRSTPFTRWRAGNLVRLLFATSVGLYGFILRVLGGPIWQGNCLFALAMILLSVWKPGRSPNTQAAHPS